MATLDRNMQKKRTIEHKERNQKKKKILNPERINHQALIDEIMQLEALECESRLTGDGRMRKKHLTDRFNSVRKARQELGLEPIELPIFDSDEYVSKKHRKSSTKQQPLSANSLSHTLLPLLPPGPIPLYAPPGLAPFRIEQ
jgi:hypothetical protein